MSSKIAERCAPETTAAGRVADIIASAFFFLARFNHILLDSVP